MPLRNSFTQLFIFFSYLIINSCAPTSQSEVKNLQFERVFIPADSILVADKQIDLGFQTFQIKATNKKVLLTHPDKKEILCYEASLASKGIVYGKNKSQYFQSINSLNADEEGIYIVDASFKSVSHFNYEDSIVFFQHFSDFPLRSTRLHGFHYLFKGIDFQSREDYFKVIDLQNYRGHPIEFPLKNQKDGGFAQDGIFTSNDNQLFYIGTWLSHLTSFDSLGHILYTTNTIDNTQKLPEIIYEANRQYLKEGSQPVNKAATANNQYIFVLSSAPGKNEQEALAPHYNCIDIYEASSGSYLYSCKLPIASGQAPIQAISANAKGLYVCQGNFLSLWRFK